MKKNKKLKFKHPNLPVPKTKPSSSGAKGGARAGGKCRALEVGHRSCTCGGPYCGEQVP